MAVENGEWIMHGLDWDDPYRIRSDRELIAYVDATGFLPLFKNEIEGFSVEEHVSDLYWWTGNEEEDPWEWRITIARSGKVAYGKFFNKKSGFISREWFPYFANYRRDGYDFDARWDDELASLRSRKLMDPFATHKEFAGYELKARAGFGKGGEKNFSGIVTELQMQTYLTIKDFRQRRNKKGDGYGMPVSIYTRPEDWWGTDLVRSAYCEDPEKSWERILKQAGKLYPDAEKKQLERMLGI